MFSWTGIKRGTYIHIKVESISQRSGPNRNQILFAITIECLSSKLERNIWRSIAYTHARTQNTKLNQVETVFGTHPLGQHTQPPSNFQEKFILSKCYAYDKIRLYFFQKYRFATYCFRLIMFNILQFKHINKYGNDKID